MEFRLTSLLDTLQIDFGEPYTLGPIGEYYFLVTVENLAVWLIARATNYDMTEEVLKSLKEEIIFCFDSSKTIISNDERCFTAK